MQQVLGRALAARLCPHLASSSIAQVKTLHSCRRYRQSHAARYSSTGITMAQAAVSGQSAEGETFTQLPGLTVQRVPCLSDNYVWVLSEASSGMTAVVDPSEAAPVAAALEERGLRPDYILNTHHHWDHTGGNLELKQRYNASVVGPAADAARIPGIDIALADGETWEGFGGLEMRVFDTPGHTRGHITLWFPAATALFPGDTLFALGCGRLFEGTPETMWASLSKLLPLPRETRVFCAHEYTQSNARFAVSVDAGNGKLQERKKLIDEQRSKGMATVPSLLGDELDTNPFLRPHNEAIRSALGVPAGASDVQAFAAIRKAKDSF